MNTYSIVRFYFNGQRKTIKTGLTLEEAKEHCTDLESSSKSCEHPENISHTKQHGPWFDGREKE